MMAIVDSHCGAVEGLFSVSFVNRLMREFCFSAEVTAAQGNLNALQILSKMLAKVSEPKRKEIFLKRVLSMSIEEDFLNDETEFKKALMLVPKLCKICCSGGTVKYSDIFTVSLKQLINDNIELISSDAYLLTALLTVLAQTNSSEMKTSIAICRSLRTSFVSAKTTT